MDPKRPNAANTRRARKHHSQSFHVVYDATAGDAAIRQAFRMLAQFFVESQNKNSTDREAGA